MPETFAVFMFSLGEAQRYLDALTAAGEDDLAEPFADILDQDDGPPQLAEPLLSAAQMVELTEHIRGHYGQPAPTAAADTTATDPPRGPR